MNDAGALSAFSRKGCLQESHYLPGEAMRAIMLDVVDTHL